MEGETIECLADGQPAASFVWRSVAEGVSVESPSLLLTDAMLGSQTWQCTATNVLQGLYHNASQLLTFYVTGQLGFLASSGLLHSLF